MIWDLLREDPEKFQNEPRANEIIFGLPCRSPAVKKKYVVLLSVGQEERESKSDFAYSYEDWRA